MSSCTERGERQLGRDALWAERRCAKSPAVFCYDLMNEPFVPGGRRRPGEWYSGQLLGGYDFVQFISLGPAGRSREEVARQWVRRLTQAIHRHDRRHLITVGMLPWAPKWGILSGFNPEQLAPELDFISVHIYPEAGKVPEALAILKRFAAGKPVVEETFPLACSGGDLERFLPQSRGIASGWLGHYLGVTRAQLEARRRAKTLTMGQALMAVWLGLFTRLKAQMVPVLGGSVTNVAQSFQIGLRSLAVRARQERRVIYLGDHPSAGPDRHMERDH